MNEKLPNRKRVRAKYFNYSQPGVYFITICTQNRQCTLSKIVGTGVPDGPQITLTEIGKIAQKYIEQLNSFYADISVDRYVIMPNHIHLLLRISYTSDTQGGPSGTPVPTAQNSTLSRFVSTFKRFCNKEIGQSIWQSRSYDHIVRNEHDYIEISKYIEENPLRWQYDKLYEKRLKKDTP